MSLRYLFLAVCVPALTGCAGAHYSHTQVGTLDGRVTIEWYKPDVFLYRPDEESPLKFVRQDGTAIAPQTMYTDGGSIPRPFWVLRNYSPWGYGPAFVVHDWLFHMQNCKLPGHLDYSLEEAAVVMSEVMKTLMETRGFDYGSKSSVYLMYEAVQSPPAVDAWRQGECVAPPADDVRARMVPDATFVVEAP